MRLRRRPPNHGDEVAAWLASSGWPPAERARLLEPDALEALLSSPPPPSLPAFLAALQPRSADVEEAAPGPGERRAG